MSFERMKLRMYATNKNMKKRQLNRGKKGAQKMNPVIDKGILNICESFYQELYTSKDIPKSDINQYLKNLKHSKTAIHILVRIF